MEIIESKFKAVDSVNKFNSCMGKSILKGLQTLNAKFVDLDDPFWKNEEDTIVFQVNGESFHDGLNVGQIIFQYSPDEFSYIMISKNIVVIRLWWD